MTVYIIIVAVITVISHYFVLCSSAIPISIGQNYNTNSGSNTTSKNSSLSGLNNSSDLLNVSLQFLNIDTLSVSWTMQTSWRDSSNISVSGFVVSYSILGIVRSDNVSDKGDLNLEFRSPILGPSSKSFVLTLPQSQEFQICMYAKLKLDENDIGKSLSSCSNVSNSYYSDVVDNDKEETIDIRKMASGIAAGCVFLIPCVVLLVYIMRKDKQMRLSMYEGLSQTEQLNPAFSLKDEEKKILGTPGEGSSKDAHAWRTLSLRGLVAMKTENGPTIYIHTNGEEEEGGVEEGAYSVRL